MDYIITVKIEINCVKMCLWHVVQDVVTVYVDALHILLLHVVYINYFNGVLFVFFGSYSGDR